MRIRWILGLGLLSSLVIAGGCSQNTDDAALASESNSLRSQLEQRTAALEAAEAERRQLEMENAELRRQLDELAAGGATGFEGIDGVTSSYDNGAVTVSIASDILFDPGANDLKRAAKNSLDQVASVISSQYGSREIRIAGHTDSDPIRKSGWKSNYHLGAERAYAVMEYLKSKGVPESRMHIASFGPNRSLATKAASRRVEIVVLMDNT